MILLIWPCPLSDNSLYPVPTERTLEMLSGTFLYLRSVRCWSWNKILDWWLAIAPQPVTKKHQNQTKELEKNVKMQRSAWNEAAENLDSLQPKTF